MTEDIPPVSESTPQNWLAAEPTPAPVVKPPPAPKSTFSLYALFALIAGVTIPLVAIVLSVILAVAPIESRQEAPLLLSIILAVGLLGLPLAWFALLRLRGRSITFQAHVWWVAVASILVVVLLIVGQLCATYDILPPVTLGLIQPLVFLVACAGIVAMVIGNWKGMTQFRTWGSFISGAWLSVGVALAAEAVLVGVAVVVGLLILMVIAPEDANRIIALVRNPDNLNIEAFYDFALRPWAIIGVFLGAAFLVPLIEELLKPLGVILVLGRRPTPMAAFVGGLLGGLGFAFTESLSNLMAITDPWFILVVARLGTLIMHGFASALVGWGWGQLASKKPLGLLLAYAGAVFIHGLWNGMVVVVVFSSIYLEQNGEATTGLGAVLGLLSGLSVIIILSLVPICIVGLIWAGYRLRSSAPDVTTGG
jgi:RsiW-degrading membrane proteinase PrsW (M82 family)